MKKFLIGISAIGVAVGLLAAASGLYAGETAQVDAVESLALDEEAAAHDAWRTDLENAVAADEEYAAAKATLDAYEGADEVEHARLTAVRDEIYYAIARVVYEDHFGPWGGDDDTFVAFFQAAEEDKQTDIIATCAAQAIRVCGEGKVKSVTVTDGGGCSFVCGTVTAVP